MTLRTRHNPRRFLAALCRTWTTSESSCSIGTQPGGSYCVWRGRDDLRVMQSGGVELLSAVPGTGNAATSIATGDLPKIRALPDFLTKGRLLAYDKPSQRCALSHCPAASPLIFIGPRPQGKPPARLRCS